MEPDDEEHASGVLWLHSSSVTYRPKALGRAPRLTEAVSFGVKPIVQEPGCWVQTLALPLTSRVT